MFFILSKALLFLLSPFFWLAVCIGLYFFRKNTKWRPRYKWIALTLFIFFSNTFVFSEFCRLWEEPGIKTSALEKHDVAIVLGGMFEYNGDLETLTIRRQGDRLFQAITLYKTGKVSKLLISGDSGFVTDRGLHEAKQIKKILISWGIPEMDVISEEKSTNTHENAVETKKMLDKSYPHFNKFILVTSGIHMTRAMACFEREGLKCTPYSTDLYSSQTRNYYWDQYIIPNVDNFNTWNKLFKEMVGYVVYDVVGYI